MEPKFLLVPDEARADLDELLDLDAEKLVALRAALNERTVAGEGREFARVAEKLGVGYDQAIKVLSSVRNIRVQRTQFGLDDDQLYDDLVAVGGELQASAQPEYRAALLAVLARSDEEYFADKVSELRHALVPHLSDVRSIVDARPIFDKAHGKIEGFVIVTHLELTAHDRLGELTHHPFYLSRADIKRLQDALTDAAAKVELLENQLAPAEVWE